MPDSWYADVVARLRPFDCKVAVDTSDAPLAHWPPGSTAPRRTSSSPMPRNSGRASVAAEHLEAALAQGDPDPVVGAARQLIDRGAHTVLATLGPRGRRAGR